MSHVLQERYSKLVLAKLRKELVLKDGVVFNNDYEGDPKAGAVKIPTRDTEATVGDYNTATGYSPNTGSTAYTTLTINKDKAVNEIIDGYEADAVPDNLVADRLDSASYALAAKLDSDGGAALIAGATADNFATLTTENVYDTIVDIRTKMSKANVPNDNKRYLLVTPDTLALLLKSSEFIGASALGDEVKQTGAIGRIAGFNIYEWNDSTANLAMVAGHPRFATRVNEWSVPAHLVSLDGSGSYIGASAVQGRMVYGHMVVRAAAIHAVYSPSALGTTAAAASTSGKTVITVTGQTEGATLKYKVNPAANAVYGATYDGTALTSGTTQIAVSAGDIVEVVELDSNSKIKAAGYHVMAAAEIKA